MGKSGTWRNSDGKVTGIPHKQLRYFTGQNVSSYVFNCHLEHSVSWFFLAYPDFNTKVHWRPNSSTIDIETENCPSLKILVSISNWDPDSSIFLLKPPEGFPPRSMLWGPPAHADGHSAWFMSLSHRVLPQQGNAIGVPVTGTVLYVHCSSTQKMFRFIKKITYLLFFMITPLMSHFCFIFIYQNKVNSSLPIAEEQGIRLIIKISL